MPKKEGMPTTPSFFESPPPTHRAVEPFADPEPGREVKPGLGPRELPRDGPQGLDPALGVALGRARPDVEAAQLELGSGRAEVPNEVGVLKKRDTQK